MSGWQTEQTGQTKWHLNLTFQVSCDWQLSQFLQCFSLRLHYRPTQWALLSEGCPVQGPRSVRWPKENCAKKSAAAVNAIICINLSGSWRCRRKNDQAAEVAGAVIKFCETDAPTHSLFRWSQNWPSFKACWHCSEIVLILFLFAHIRRETSIVIK